MSDFEKGMMRKMEEQFTNQNSILKEELRQIRLEYHQFKSEVVNQQSSLKRELILLLSKKLEKKNNNYKAINQYADSEHSEIDIWNENYLSKLIE
jgi:hypothetical protein